MNSLPDAEQIQQFHGMVATMCDALPAGSYWEKQGRDIFIIVPLKEADEDKTIADVEKTRQFFLTEAIKPGYDLRCYATPLGNKEGKLFHTAFCNHDADQSKAYYFGIRREARCQNSYLEGSLTQALGPPGVVPPMQSVPPSTPRLMDTKQLEAVSGLYAQAVSKVLAALKGERDSVKREVMRILKDQVHAQGNASQLVLSRLEDVSTPLAEHTTTVVPWQGRRVDHEPLSLSADLPSDLYAAVQHAQQQSDRYVDALNTLSAGLNTACERQDAIANAKIVKHIVRTHAKLVGGGAYK